MRVRCFVEALGIAVFFLTLPILKPAVHAADPPDAIAQIRSTSSSYLEALKSGDADRIAAFWTPQGTFVDADNNTFQAQKLVRLEFPKDAARQQQSNVGEQRSNIGEQRSKLGDQSTIRLITPDVALEQASASANKTDQTVSSTTGSSTTGSSTTGSSATGSSATGSSATGSSETSHLAIWVKTDKRWLLDYLQEFHVSTELQEGHLAELGWMVGQWESQSEGIDARLTVTWSEQRRFLIQRFTVQLPDQDELRVEQRIAWDAANKQIRSWLFRSDGGFAEAVWSLEGDAWVVKKSEVTPNGEKTATVNLWVNEDPDSCWFKSLHAKTDDQPAEDLLLQFRRMDSP